jgi:predicted ATPase/DNA-binding CsgD family transcriptional regulator
MMNAPLSHPSKDLLVANSTPADWSQSQQAPLVPFPDWNLVCTLPPVPLTSFIGREREVAAIIRLLRHDVIRLVTLTGPGGVGKTRLALRVVETLEADFADGVAFVSLAPLADPSLVAATIAHAIGVREVRGRSIAELLPDAIADRRLLLVLDNFEQVVEAAPLVPGLLAGCPNLMVLATSRTILRVSGEQRFLVSPLIVPSLAKTNSAKEVGTTEAVRLFVDRARAADPSFALTAQNAPTIAEVCRRLDGLPLAIELAAARICLLPPTAMLARMERRLPLLTGGPQDAPARLRTMRDAIAWSHELITPAEQTLFRRLGVFVGGFTVEAAEAVACDGGDVFEGVASLVANSLLRQDAGADGGPDPESSWASPRFRMLETVREFALEQLAASGEADVIRGRHAAWCLALAEQSEIATWGGPQQVQWLDRLETELPNLRGALGWLEETGDLEATSRLAGELNGLWFNRSHRTEGHAWLQRALARADEVPTVGRAKALTALAKLSMFLGREEAATLAAESLVMWTELGDAWRAADARLALGMVLQHQGDYERAAPLLEDVAAQLDALGEPVRAALALLNLGSVALACGDGTRAEALLEEVLGRFRRGGYQWAVPTTLLGLGEAAVNRGDVTAAAAYYAESLALARNREDLVSTLVRTARLAADRRALVATRLLGAAAALAETVNDPLMPAEQARCQDAVTEARASLGDTNFEAAWTAGQTLTAEQATAEATEILAAMGAPSAPSTAANNPFGLTPRESEILTLLTEGRSNQAIADSLFISPRTAKNHVAHILAKLGVGSRASAVAYALRHGLA